MAAKRISEKNNAPRAQALSGRFRWKDARWWAPLLFILLGFAAYSNTFGVTPRFDDSIFIFDRIQVRDLARIWTEGDLFRKIPYLTFALNYRWTGQTVWSWHLVNLVLHILTTCFVYGIARTIWRSPALQKSPLSTYAAILPVFTGLLFLCHPIQTSAVTYIYQRMIVIATLFHAAAIYGYLRARVDGRRRFWLLALSASVLAVFTKQVNMTLPLTLLFTEIAFCSDSLTGFFKRGVRFLPFAAVPAALYFWVMKIDLTRLSFDMLKRLYPLNINSEMSWHDWVLTQINVMRTYLRLLVFPMNQTLDYDYPVAKSWSEPGVWVSLATIFFTVALGVWCWRRYRAVSWGIFFMAAVLALEFFAIRDIIFEHRLYLPMLGFAVAVPPLTAAIVGDRRRLKILVVALVAALAVAAFARNAVWADEEKFWLEGIRHSPNKGRPYYSLGVYYALRGEHARAVPLYQRAVQIWPGFADAYSNLGKSLEETGHVDQAIFYYARALELDPTLPEALNNYGSALVRSGRQVEAREIYKKAMGYKPDNFEAMSNMGSTYAQLGEYGEAEKWYRRSIQTNPLHAPAHSNLASILFRRNDYAGAEASSLEAIRLDPNYFEARFNLATLYVKTGELAKAEAEYLQAIRIRPDYYEGHNNLGTLLAGKREFSRAEEHFKKAVLLNPSYKDAAVNLINVLYYQNKLDEARSILSAVMTRWPHDARVQESAKKLLQPGQTT